MCLKCNNISKNVGNSIDFRIFSLSNTKPINRQNDKLMKRLHVSAICRYCMELTALVFILAPRVR